MYGVWILRPPPIPVLPRPPRQPITAGDVPRYLTDLPKLWREIDPAGRRAIAEAAFDRIDAMGLDLVIHPSAEAERYSWSEAFGSEPLVYAFSRSGRGERLSPDKNDLLGTVRMAPRGEADNAVRVA